MKVLGSLGVLFTTNVADLEKDYKRAENALVRFQQKTKEVGDSMAAVGKKMSLYITAPIVGAFTLGIRSAMAFETAMARVTAGSGLSAERVSSLGKEVKKLALELSRSPTELAEALKDIQDRGYDMADSMKLVIASTNAAKGGFSTVGQAAETLTGALRAYSFTVGDATRVSDILLKVSKDMNVPFGDLGDRLSSINVLAKQAGIRLPEVASALLASRKGSLSAADSFSGLQRLLIQLSQERSPEMTKAFRAMGFESAEAALKSKGLLGTLLALNQYAGGDTKMISKLGMQRQALAAFLALTKEGGANFKASFKQMESISGETASSVAAFGATGAASISKLTTSVSALNMSISEALVPALTTAATKAKDMVDSFNAMSPAGKTTAASVLAVAAGAGPLISILANVGKAAGTLAVVGGKLASSWRNFATAMASMSTGTAAAAFVLIAMAVERVYAIYNAFQAKNQAIQEEGDTLGALTEQEAGMKKRYGVGSAEVLRAKRRAGIHLQDKTAKTSATVEAEGLGGGLMGPPTPALGIGFDQLSTEEKIGSLMKRKADLQTQIASADGYDKSLLEDQSKEVENTLSMLQAQVEMKQKLFDNSMKSLTYEQQFNKLLERRQDIEKVLKNAKNMSPEYVEQMKGEALSLEQKMIELQSIQDQRINGKEQIKYAAVAEQGSMEAYRAQNYKEGPSTKMEEQVRKQTIEAERNRKASETIAALMRTNQVVTIAIP